MNYYLNITIKEQEKLNEIIKAEVKDNDLDQDRLETELEKRLKQSSTKLIRSPYWFIKSTIENLIKEHASELKAVHEEPIKNELHGYYYPLHEDLLEKGYKETPYTYYLIQLVEDYVMNYENVTPDQLTEINHNAVRNCTNKTFEGFLDEVLKSLPHCNVPVERLRKQAKEQIDELNKILDEIA